MIVINNLIVTRKNSLDGSLREIRHNYRTNIPIEINKLEALFLSCATWVTKQGGAAFPDGIQEKAGRLIPADVKKLSDTCYRYIPEFLKRAITKALSLIDKYLLKSCKRNANEIRASRHSSLAFTFTASSLTDSASIAESSFIRSKLGARYLIPST